MPIIAVMVRGGSMACCAFAVYLISQIIYLFDNLRLRVGGRDGAHSYVNNSVAWNLSPDTRVDVPFESSRQRIWFGHKYLLHAVLFLTLGGLAIVELNKYSMTLDSSWCRSLVDAIR